MVRQTEDTQVPIDNLGTGRAKLLRVEVFVWLGLAALAHYLFAPSVLMSFCVLATPIIYLSLFALFPLEHARQFIRSRANGTLAAGTIKLSELKEIDEQVVNLWSKYEDIAMHFNDLMMRWRLQAMGGLATLVTVGGFVAGDAPCNGARYRAIIILSGTLFCAWVGVATLDIWYYRNLLRGAVDSICRIERIVPSLRLSTRIEEVAKRSAMAPWLFYALGAVPLALICVWAVRTHNNLPADQRDPAKCIAAPIGKDRSAP